MIRPMWRCGIILTIKCGILSFELNHIWQRGHQIFCCFSKTNSGTLNRAAFYLCHNRIWDCCNQKVSLVQSSWIHFWQNKNFRLKNCKIFIRNFEACVTNGSQFHNSADRLRFDLPTTEFAMNLHRNNRAVLSADLGDVLLDLAVILRYSNKVKNK